MNSAEERNAADKALEEAISNVLRVYEIGPEDQILVDFVVVTECTVMSVKGDSEHHGLLMRHGQTRKVVLRGLLYEGLSLIDDQSAERM